MRNLSFMLTGMASAFHSKLTSVYGPEAARAKRLVAASGQGEHRAGDRGPLDGQVDQSLGIEPLESESALRVCRRVPATGAGFPEVIEISRGRLRRLAAEFRAAHDMRGVTDFRFDVAAVVGTDVEVIEAAF